MEDNDMKVLVNDEEQYSLWPTYLAIPSGWRDTGAGGTKEESLAYVNEVWTDMRPLSLRKKMEDPTGQVQALNSPL